MFSAQLISKMIQGEIDWCLSDEGKRSARKQGLTEEYAKGFLGGMEQIKTIFNGLEGEVI